MSSESLPGDSETRSADSSPRTLPPMKPSHFRSLSAAGAGGKSLEWTNVSFSVSGKKILDDCSGIIRPGELTAVMGPSGSGKSTLMNVLGGRQSLSGDGKKSTGKVSFNGKVQDPSNFKSHIAYVMQDDNLVATATPEEVLEFSANLRLGNTKKEDIRSLVDDLLDSLKLTKCKDTVVGNDVLKGISGGERKRTSVGMELITQPQMIFLDEPLSGLDSYAATTTVKVLKDLALSGVAVMVTVHQPSSEIFAMFDNVLAICDGQMIYSGPCGGIVDFFYDNGGFECPASYSPADFVLYTLQTAARDDVHKLAVAYRKMAEKEVFPEVEVIRGQAVDSPSLKPKTRIASVSTQMKELFLREYRDTYRNPSVLIARYAVQIILGLIFGCVFWQTASSEPESYWLTNIDKFQSYFGGMVTVCISAMMGAAQSTILRYPEQRGIFLREYASNMYGSIPYVISKTFVELPLSFVDSLVSVIISFWMMNFQGNFFYWLLTAWILNIASSSLAQLFGAWMNSGAQAMQMLPLLFVPQMVFSGLFTRINNIPVWLRWFQYLCALKYGINLAYFNEFGYDMTTLQQANNTNPDLLGLDIGVLFLLIIGLRVAANLILRRKARYVF